MIKADEIEKCASMIHSYVNSLHGNLMDEIGGYLPRLKKVADAGGFITLNTIEEMTLLRDCERLLDVVETIRVIRQQLIANSNPEPEKANEHSSAA